MKIVSSYKVKIREASPFFFLTLDKFREAVDCLIGITLLEWDALSAIEEPQAQQRQLEKLTHATAGNRDFKYPEFDERFPSFPSYLRRAACTARTPASNASKNARGTGSRSLSAGTPCTFDGSKTLPA